MEVILTVGLLSLDEGVAFLGTAQHNMGDDKNEKSGATCGGFAVRIERAALMVTWKPYNL